MRRTAPLVKFFPFITFPSRRGSACVLIAVTCLISASANAAQTTKDSDKALKDMRNKITATSQRARKFEQESNSLDLQINDLRQQLVSAAGKIQAAEQDVFTREDRLEVLNLQEKNLSAALKSRYGQMARTLGAMQRLSQQPAEMVAYRPEKAINSLRSAALLKILQPELKKRADIIREDITELTLIRDQITQEHEELTLILASLTLEQIDMNQLLQARRQKQVELRQATREERRKLKQFAAQASSLKDLIAQIKQENKARERASLAAASRTAEKPGSASPAPSNKSARLKLDSWPGANLSFRQAKGTIPLPARGAIRRTFGSKTPEGQSSEGITIQTRPRATVISPHEGRIVFAGKFRSYGLLLIIAHGPEYHTLLAGMTRLDAEVGQWVLKGEPIGQMATDLDKTKTTGAVTGQNLYVELRRMGKPINPLPWIVARDRKVL